MSVEIANVVHALARLALNNPPVITEAFGIIAVNRLSTGNYELTTSIPIDIQQGIGICQPAAGAAAMTSVRVRDYGSFGPGNILVQTFDAAGAAVEGGNCVVALFRFPSIEAT